MSRLASIEMYLFLLPIDAFHITCAFCTMHASSVLVQVSFVLMNASSMLCTLFLCCACIFCAMPASNERKQIERERERGGSSSEMASVCEHKLLS